MRKFFIITVFAGAICVGCWGEKPQQTTSVPKQPAPLSAQPREDIQFVNRAGRVAQAVKKPEKAKVAQTKAPRRVRIGGVPHLLATRDGRAVYLDLRTGNVQVQDATGQWKPIKALSVVLLRNIYGVKPGKGRYDIWPNVRRAIFHPSDGFWAIDEHGHHVYIVIPKVPVKGEITIVYRPSPRHNYALMDLALTTVNGKVVSIRQEEVADATKPPTSFIRVENI